MSAQEAFNFQGEQDAEFIQGYPLMGVDERGVLTLPGSGILLRHAVERTGVSRAEMASEVQILSTWIRHVAM